MTDIHMENTSVARFTVRKKAWRGGRKDQALDRERCKKHWKSVKPTVWNEKKGIEEERDPLPAEIVLGRKFTSFVRSP